MVKKSAKDWRGNRKEKADRAGYRAKVEEEMTDFSITMEEMIQDRWTAEKRFETFKVHLCRAADQTLRRIKCGKGRRNLKGWWDQEVKEAIRRRKKHPGHIEEGKNSMNSSQKWQEKKK